MHKIKKSIGILALAIFSIGAIIILIKPNGSNVPINPASVTSSVSEPANTNTSNQVQTNIPTANDYTLADVSKHNSASSCWAAINGGVYDVTTFIDQHPGGTEAILSLCGTDGSAAFNNQHGDQKRPNNELAGFKIGNLIN